MAVHAAKRHGRRKRGREGDWEGRGKEERQTTQTAAAGSGREGEGEKLPNAEEGGKETESKRANGMAVEDTETERAKRER